ncbi:MAG: phage terminase large subunit family protein [Gemmataceae bacterium]|nr:phage terminase large subunit family protein [Gemmataceae bacterium]
MPREPYEKFKRQQAEISRQRSEAGREIGPLPACADPTTVTACRSSLQQFCETYLAERFPLAWSDDHLKAISKIEAAVLFGGLFALAMARGSGKTSLSEAAALWAILYGHRRFVVLIGATDEAAVEMLDSIKLAVETNDLIGADFPAAAFPVRALEGINNRAAGQTLDGERTRITWTAAEAVFPTVPVAPSSGARIRVAGITGRVRGMKAATADGKTIRPDFAIADDPQTDQSAVSLTEIDKRERRLRGAVKGLAGPGKTIAMVVPCTVIAPRDLSDRILDRDRNPQFQGERMRMVYTFPTRADLWDQYAELRRDSLAADGRGEAASEFYRAHRAEMDRGALVAWPARYDSACELSAVQAAMNLLIDNRREFFAEYQNQPEDEINESVKEITAEAVAAKLNKVPRGTVPREMTRLTAFIDCGGKVLWYAVVAWDERFNGAVVDYGAYPRQNRAYFDASDARPSLTDLPGWENYSEPQRVYAGLVALAGDILGREYPRQDTGEPLRVARCLVDSGWLPDTVHLFVRQAASAAVLLPSKGHARGSNSRPIDEWARKPGERAGWMWRLGAIDGRRSRQLVFDPDAWKSFIADRLLTPAGGAGCLTLFGADPGAHQLFADHCTAEYATRTMARGITYDKWLVKPDRRDNHLWDCLVGAAVAASVEGLTWSDNAAAPAGPAKPRKRRNIEEMYAAANRG